MKGLNSFWLILFIVFLAVACEPTKESPLNGPVQIKLKDGGSITCPFGFDPNPNSQEQIRCHQNKTRYESESITIPWSNIYEIRIVNNIPQ